MGNFWKAVGDYKKLYAFYNKIFSLLMGLVCSFALAAPTTSLETVTTIEAFQSTITGTITDASGVPLPGANVVIKGTRTGAAADFDGNYSIQACAGVTIILQPIYRI